MAKMTISESRLHELIQESIYEVLQEAQYDEGLGTLLGGAVRNLKKIPEKLKKSWQGFKDDFNTAKNNEPQDTQDVTGKPRSLAGLYGYAKERYWQKKKDWEDKVAAGSNYARYKYKDRDVVGDEYGQEMANNIRNYGTEPYRQDRLNNWRTQRGLEPQGVQPHPDLIQQPNKLQQVRIDRENQAKQALYKSGMVPQGSKDTITGWVRKDGQQPDENQLKLIDNWKRVKLYEAKEKLNSLLEQLNEIGDTDRGQYMLGKLANRKSSRGESNRDVWDRAQKEIGKVAPTFSDFADTETAKEKMKKAQTLSYAFDDGLFGLPFKTKKPQ